MAMRRPTRFHLALIAALLAFTACGDEAQEDDTASRVGTTLHVLAKGMVESLGIT